MTSKPDRSSVVRFPTAGRRATATQAQDESRSMRQHGGRARVIPHRAEVAELEIGSTRNLVLVGVTLIILLVGGLAGWSSLAPLSSAVVAQGVVKVRGDRRVVEHLEGGIIRRLLVGEGDRVTTGQTVALLDDAKLAAGRKVIQAKLSSALAREARVLAEQKGAAAVVFPDELVSSDDPDTAHLMRAQSTLFETRRNTLAGALLVKDRKLAQVRDEIGAYQAQLASGEQQLVFLREELGDLETLMRKGLTRKPRMLALQRQAESISGDGRQKQSLIARSRKELATIEQEKHQLLLERMDEIGRERREVLDEIVDARQRIAVMEEQMRRLVVTAPISGTVIGVGPKTSGAVVSPGERMMEIVPEDAELVIEVHLSPGDIEGVKTGARVRIRITAYNARRTPVVLGTVEQVSADRLEQPAADKQGSRVDGSVPPRPYYKVIVKPQADQQAPHAPILAPGMPAEAYIETRNLTLADYVLAPLIIGIDHAFQGR